LYTPTRGYLILKRGRTKSPNASEHEVRLVHIPGGVRRTVFWRQQALEQRAQHLYVRDLRDGRDDLELRLERLQAGRHVLLEQHHQRGLFGRVLPGVDPAGRVRVPAQVRRVYVQDAGAGHGGRRGRPQVGDLEKQAHGRRQRDTFVASQRQYLDEHDCGVLKLKCGGSSTVKVKLHSYVLTLQFN